MIPFGPGELKLMKQTIEQSKEREMSNTIDWTKKIVGNKSGKIYTLITDKCPSMCSYVVMSEDGFLCKVYENGKDITGTQVVKNYFPTPVTKTIYVTKRGLKVLSEGDISSMHKNGTMFYTKNYGHSYPVTITFTPIEEE